MVEVGTSLLDVEESNVIQNIYDLEVAGTDYFHIDVMDGKFVENDTIEKMRKYTEYLKQISTIPIDVHLMVEDVEPHISDYLALEVSSITFHLEACKNEKEVLKYISYIKDNNTKVGVSINPNTDVEKLFGYLPYIHKVLLMTVEPGKGGQKFIPESIDKIKMLNRIIYENNFDVDIVIDGGINDETAVDAKKAGINVLVAGNYIIKSGDFKEAISKLK